MKTEIYDASQLPAPMKSELAAMLQALHKKYGARAVKLVVHIENLATACAMLARPVMSEQERAKACDSARDICMGVLRDLGAAWQVDPTAAFAVAHSLQDFTRRVEAELIGEEIPAEVTEQAASIIAAASKPAAKPADPN